MHRMLQRIFLGEAMKQFSLVHVFGLAGFNSQALRTLSHVLPTEHKTV